MKILSIVAIVIAVVLIICVIGWIRQVSSGHYND